jgi:hypothetical protein
MLAAAPAIPKKPKAPAIKAITRNTNVQCNIRCCLLALYSGNLRANPLT